MELNCHLKNAQLEYKNVFFKNLQIYQQKIANPRTCVIIYFSKIHAVFSLYTYNGAMHKCGTIAFLFTENSMNGISWK